MLQRLFFEHFQPTSFVIEQHAEIQGFLVGFQSQTTPTQAYIHFVGVHTGMRGQGIGRRLYEHFFEVVRQLGCTEARCSGYLRHPFAKSAVCASAISLSSHFALNNRCYCQGNREQAFPCSVNLLEDASATKQKHGMFVSFMSEKRG
jgi:GNAT superfamily N-acetyltransferase